MRRYGESIKRGVDYKLRVGVYGVILIGNKVLLTDQHGHELQLPGGGIDKGEQNNHALVREVREETGWKINPIRKIGIFQRFVFMPEYDLWAHKICHIYYCKGIYPLSKPLEKGHYPVLISANLAAKLLENDGDRAFLKLCLQ